MNVILIDDENQGLDVTWRHAQIVLRGHPRVDSGLAVVPFPSSQYLSSIVDGLLTLRQFATLSSSLAPSLIERSETS